ncbi:uncharacterized protein VICG_02081, partial [Vittaforma corneae ATCC 50505]
GADPAVLAAIRTANSPFQQSVAAAIQNIYTSDKQSIAAAKDSLKKELSDILNAATQKTVACIKDAFRKFTNAARFRFNIIHEGLKKHLEEILKTGESGLVAGLVQVNRRVCEGVRYVLSLCADALSGRGCDEPKLPLTFLAVYQLKHIPYYLFPKGLHAVIFLLRCL